MLTEREREILREWDEFSKAVPPSIDELREAYARYSEGQNRDLPQIAEYKEAVELRSGLHADLALPQGKGSHPVMLYIHGGAWVAGSARTHQKVAMEFAKQGYLAFNLDYRLAPEHPFPAGFDDCVFAAHWIAENAKRWSGDSSRMFIGGDSAGGNLSAATLLALNKKSDGPRFKAGVLIYGLFDFPAALERASQSGGAFEPIAQAYLGASYPAALTDPRVSPLRGIARGALPPCVIVVGAADELVVESKAMAEEMKRKGIEHELHIFEQMPHAFLQMGELSSCKEAFRRIFDFLKKSL